jgi:hypothetical protein
MGSLKQGLGGGGGIDVSNIGLSPEQAALANFTLGQNQTRTGDIYSRLGLGGSTMETQDLAGNQLGALAQEASLIQGNQQTALQQGALNLQAQTAQNAQTAQTASALGKIAGSVL